VLVRVLLGLAVIALVAAFYVAGVVRDEAAIHKLGREFHADVARRQATSDEVDQDLENRLTKLERQQSEQLDVAKVAEKVEPSVVTIIADDDQATGQVLGTGFVVAPAEGGSWVATNYHVVKGDTYTDRRTVTVHQGQQQWSGYVWNWAEKDDVALVKVGHDLPALPAATGTIKVGDPVIAYGSPYGLENTVTVGVVSAIRGNYIQTDAPINHGNSGGPLLNKDGEVVGMTTLALANSNSLGFAVRIQRVCDLLDGGC
jgi:S1-C subfamily serine protease